MLMKKVAILTHPPAKNYGGILQALALCSAVKSLGYDCTLLYGPVKKLSMLKQLKESIRKVFGCGKERPYMHLKNFVQKYLPVSEPWNGVDMVDCDCFIVGSDQVWRPEYIHLPGAYFLDFVPANAPVKRIAYAASFGVDKWLFSPEQTGKFGGLLRKFDAVSVRETSGVALCREYWQCQALQMPDPTLLHDSDFYRQFFEKSGSAVPQNELFTYFLDSTAEKNELADCFAENNSLQRNNFLAADKKSIRRPVEEFLSGIARSRFVLTDSFHGMVFAMIFGIPYAVIGNAKRGMSRFELTVNAGVPQAVLPEFDQLEALQQLYKQREFYAPVADFLKKERQRGRAFLQKHCAE